MEIQITQKQCGGTEFLARPHRLHLGAQNAAGVDQLHFILPEAWAGCSAALYLRRADGTGKGDRDEVVRHPRRCGEPALLS